MLKAPRLIIGTALCFTLLMAWFAWSAFRAAPQLAAENLRGAGLSISAAIEQLAAVEPSFQALAGYSSPDIAYFALVDQDGVIRFHTNPGLIGTVFGGPAAGSSNPGVVSEQRERLGTGEEVYLLQTRIHPARSEYQLVLALHTYRADQVIRRSRAGISMVVALSLSLWGLTGFILFMLKREEQHLAEMQRREELARLGEMGAVMAHEIRNPLASIKGFAQLVGTAGNLEQARGYADRIVSQSLRMESLVNDLLAYAREDRDERKPSDLAALVQESVAIIRMEAASSGVQVVHTPKPALMVMAAADRVRQLLLNLLKNGIQAMPDGGELGVELEQTASAALLRISDTGIGIPPDDMPHIFDPFWTSKAQGTGLGLALCRKVAQEHGGSLTVKSEVGTGSTFVLTLPLAE